MNFMCIHLLRCVSTLVFAFLIVGCASVFTHVMYVSKNPPLQTGSPLSSIKPRVVAFKEFNDVRATKADDPLLVWTYVAGHKWKVDKPPSVLVEAAIRQEFERNGHRCIAYSPGTNADFIVEGSVYRYQLSSTGGGMWESVGRVTGAVGTKLTISHFSKDMRVFSKNYQGEFGAKNPNLLTQLEQILTQAQMQMVKEISTDTELIEFLEE